VRVAAWILTEKYTGCTAEVLSYSDGGNTVAVSLCMSPTVAGVECFEWFTQLLADKSLTLVRDERFERAMRSLSTSHARTGRQNMKTSHPESGDKESPKLPTSAENVPGNDEATQEAAGMKPSKPADRQPAEGNDPSATRG